MFYERLDGGKVQCHLCPKNCTIAQGKRGMCRVRINIDGTLYSLIYRKASAIHPDPIEKKPLYHFYPNTPVLSYGSVGCNLRCRYCQNHHISQVKPEEYAGLRNTGGPKQVLRAIVRRACSGIAFTYNEPTIGYEFVREIAEAVKEKGLYTVLVSNGYLNPEPLEQLAPFLDAANIDVKSISDEDYRYMSGSTLAPVQATLEYLNSHGVVVAVTNLVVPGFNDSDAKVRGLAQWVLDKLGPNTPLHFTRYRPEYLYTAPATPLRTLQSAYRVAKEVGLNYVYVGNTAMRKFGNTYCHNCGELAISREGFYARKLYLFSKEGKVICKECETELPIMDKIPGKH